MKGCQLMFNNCNEVLRSPTDKVTKMFKKIVNQQVSVYRWFRTRHNTHRFNSFFVHSPAEGAFALFMRSSQHQSPLVLTRNNQIYTALRLHW